MRLRDAVSTLLAVGLLAAGCGSGPSDTTDKDSNTYDGPLAEANLVGHPGTNLLQDIVRTDEGERYVVGVTDGPLEQGFQHQGGNDGYVAKLVNYDEVAWVTSVGSTGDDRLTGLAVIDGDLWAGGTTSEGVSGEGTRGFMVKLDDSGNETARVDLSAEGYSDVYGVTATPGGAVAIAGERSAQDGSRDAQASVMKADGSVQWTKSISGARAYDVAATQDRVYLSAIKDVASALVRGWSLDGTKKSEFDVGQRGAVVPHGIEAESGTIYLAGEVSGSFDGQQSAGDTDGFAAAYSAEGTLQWSDLVGTSGADGFRSVHFDGQSVTVGGYASGDLGGEGFYFGGRDLAVAQFDTNGAQTDLWQRGSGYDEWVEVVMTQGNSYLTGANSAGKMFSEGRASADWNSYVYRGDGNSFAGSPVALINEGTESFRGLAVDSSGRPFAAGHATGDIAGGDPASGRFGGLVTRFADEAAADWQQAIDGEDVSFEAVQATEQALYLVGDAEGTMSSDIQISDGDTKPIAVRLGFDGTIDWVQSFPDIGVSYAEGADVALAPNGGVVVASRLYAGRSSSNINGRGDGMVAVLNRDDGSIQWSTRLAGTGYDEINGVDVDAQGNILATGTFTGTYRGDAAPEGLQSAFLTKFDAQGAHVWTSTIIERTTFCAASGVNVGPDGGIYVAGFTDRDFPGWDPIQGPGDGFVARYNTDGTRADIWQLEGGGGVVPSSLDVADDGAIAVGGFATGSVGGKQPSLSNDGFAAHISPDRSAIEMFQVASREHDWITEVSFGPNGWLHIAGETRGNLFGETNAGGRSDAAYARVRADKVVEGFEALMSR